MSLRNGLLAVVGMAALVLAAPARESLHPIRGATPLIQPLSAAEGSAFAYEPVTVPRNQSDDNDDESRPGWLKVDLLAQLFLDNFTFPLGTVPMWD